VISVFYRHINICVLYRTRQLLKIGEGEEIFLLKKCKAGTWKQLVKYVISTAIKYYFVITISAVFPSCVFLQHKHNGKDSGGSCEQSVWSTYAQK